MKRQYKIEEVKEMFTKIIQEEEKENNIKINGNLFTIAEYYKSEILKRKLKITNPKKLLRTLTAPLNLKGWYSIEDKEIIVIINGLYERLEVYLENDLIYLLRVIYHEIRHRYQIEKMKDTNKYKNFFISVERAIIYNEPSYYRLNWENFLIEIDANQDAIEKTEEYLKRKEAISREGLKIIKEIKKTTEQRYNLYDPVSIYEQFNFILQKKIKNYIKDSNTPLDDSIIELNSNIDSESYNNLKRTLSLIYSQDGSYKSIKEITAEKSIDNNIINIIFCTKSFLKSIKLNNLEDTEIKYMLHALEEFYQHENQRLKILKKINEEEQTISDLYTEKKLAKKLPEIIALRSVLMNKLLNKKKTDSNISLYNYIKKRKSNKIS